MMVDGHDDPGGAGRCEPIMRRLANLRQCADEWTDMVKRPPPPWL